MNNNDNKNPPDQDPVPHKKMSTLKIIGIILLVLFGIPLIIFGICILILTNY